jgi:ribosomal protein S18 acetylase RimI-like enzyme
MSLNVMSESSMDFVQNDVQSGLNIFLPFLNSGGYYLIALENTMIAGWVLIGPDFNPINIQKTASVISLYVLPPYRKLGLGKQLMLHALHEFKNQGFKKVQLNVYTGNPAKLLYEQLGFNDISNVMELDLNNVNDRN